jgi:hypothetical protein
MTEADYLKLAAGAFFVATAAMGLARPTWVWGGLPTFGDRSAYQKRLRTAITIAYLAIGIALVFASTP